MYFIDKLVLIIFFQGEPGIVGKKGDSGSPVSSSIINFKQVNSLNKTREFRLLS